MSQFSSEIMELCRACVVGDVAKVGELTAKNKSIINASDSEGFSPLLLATSYNMVGVVKILISNKAAINQFDLAGKCSPLLLAAQCGHADIARLLLDARASPNTRRLDYVSPLILAAKKGHADIVESLIEARASVNFVTSEGMTALYAAAREGLPDIVEMLLRHGANECLEQCKDGYTPVLIASYYGHANVVAILMDHGAHTDAADPAGCTCLHLASSGGYVEVLEIVCAYVEVVEAEDAADDDDDEHHHHRHHHHHHRVGAADSTTVGRHGETMATGSDHRIVAFEYDVHCDINRRQRDGATAFFLAAQECYLECMELLARCGADVNIARDDQVTPLLISLMEGYHDGIELLIRHKADVDQGYWSEKHGYRTPIEIALQLRDHRSVELFSRFSRFAGSSARGGSRARIQATASMMPLTPRSRSIVSAGPISPSTPLGRFSPGRRDFGTHAEDNNNNNSDDNDSNRDSVSDSETSGEDTPAVSPSYGTRQTSSASPKPKISAGSNSSANRAAEARTESPAPLLPRAFEKEQSNDMQQQQHASSTAVVVFDEQTTIAAGAHETIPLVLESETSTVGFRFTSNGGDIRFFVTFVTLGGEETVIRAPRRHDSHNHPTRGELHVDEPGTLRFHWDNSFSWFRSKTISYSVTVDHGATSHGNEGSSSSSTTTTAAIPHSESNAEVQKEEDGQHRGQQPPQARLTVKKHSEEQLATF